MNIFKTIVKKVKDWIQEENRRADMLAQIRQEREMQLEKKCEKCKTRECIWTSGYCPN